MASVTVDTDIILSVFKSADEISIGLRSRYSSIPHPGTNKVIDGWIWDERTWPDKKELDGEAFAPSIWDSATINIDQSYYQSGIGDNNDLLLLGAESVLVSGEDRWAPKVNHGYFYSHDEEWYLYSDSYITEYFTATGISDGNQFVNLSHDYKSTIPIQVRRYLYDGNKGLFHIDLNFRKVVEFQTDDEPEFMIDDSDVPIRVVVNDDYSEVVGVPVVTFPDDINELQIVGLSDGTANQQFQVPSFPIDRSQSVEVWTWNHPVSGVQEWTTLSGTDQFTVGDNIEVYVDYDRGLIKFGDYGDTATSGIAGHIPINGHKVGMYYTKGLACLYEPSKSQDYILAFLEDADINPILSSISNGFVQVTPESIDPASIFLEADLPKVNPFLIDMGNNVGKIIATVKSKSGTPIEGQEVIFEIFAPQIGAFGTTAKTTAATSAASGRAITYYNSPQLASEVGQATQTVSYSGSDTVIDVNNLSEPDDLTRLFLYRVHFADDALGITASGLDDHYEGYLSDEGVTLDPDGSAATTAYEEEWRTINQLGRPTTYDSTDITTGKKTIVLTTKAISGTVIDPTTGDLDTNNAPLDVLSPLYPTTVEDVGTSTSPVLRLTYSNISLELPNTGETRSYIVVGDTVTSMRAYTINRRTGRKIYSNTIQIKVVISDAVSGSYIVDDFNTLPSTIKTMLLLQPRNVDSIPDAQITATQAIELFNTEYEEEKLTSAETYLEWFRRTKRGDTQGLIAAELAVGGSLSPEQIEIIANGEIPVGFRLRSSGIKIASALDQVTFIQPNDGLPDDYF